MPEKDVINNNNNQPSTTIVKTDVGAKDGQTKCPKCGGTDISTNQNNGHLRCNFCRHEFEPEKFTGMQTDLSKLEGQVIGSGATDIVASTNDVLTFKCSSCGAEVVIDTASANQARCHWCRNTLSVNEQIPNGAIPDTVLPFNVTREAAKAEIDKFVGKRKFFAHPKFKQEFTSNNVMGVYFPYMLVDLNAHANLIGEGEHETRRYTVKNGDHYDTYYDADLYHVERDFDIIIDGLSVESNSDRLNKTSSEKTNNIINSIMPFDTENCVKYDSNYLKGYTSERRDVNIDNLRPLVQTQAKDIARFAANNTIKKYDRGVAWSNEQFSIKGEQWKSAYLPVWLYSYQEVKGNTKKLHYVAVNARTKETMGSVPIHIPKLLLISFFVELAGILCLLLLSEEFKPRWLLLLSGLVYYLIIYNKYRNATARHKYENDTKKEMSNLKSVDNFLKSRKGLSNSMMSGANNYNLNGTNMGKGIINSLSNSTNVTNKIVGNNTAANLIRNSIQNNNKK